jgi:hypothetical protein
MLRLLKSAHIAKLSLGTNTKKHQEIFGAKASFSKDCCTRPTGQLSYQLKQNCVGSNLRSWWVLT